MQSTNLLLIFLTGLTTGGLTCLALQGGLLATVIANQKQKGTLLPIAFFLGAKLIAHTILGFLLGALGSTISLSPTTRGWFQIIIGIYLLGVAGNLLNLHPFFRYFVITPPKFLAKLVKKTSQSNNSQSRIYDLFAPALLGFMTVLIPCATTQAIELIALSTANSIYAASIMFTFILGTSPTFLLFGFLLEKGSVSFKKYFPLVTSIAMAIMSIYSINSGVAVMGSPYTLQNFYQVATQKTLAENNAVLGDKLQTATINVTNGGYTPSNITLKRGVLTRLKLITNNVESCSRAFTIPGANIEKILPENGETTVEFTPEKAGPLAFSCSMGMYTGKFNIIN